MNNLLNKSATAAANLAVLAVCVVMASFGFAVLSVFATAGVLALGLALLAAPFLRSDEQDDSAAAVVA